MELKEGKNKSHPPIQIRMKLKKKKTNKVALLEVLYVHLLKSLCGKEI